MNPTAHKRFRRLTPLCLLGALLFAYVPVQAQTNEQLKSEAESRLRQMSPQEIEQRQVEFFKNFGAQQQAKK